MVARTMTRFAGHDSVRLEDGALTLWIAQSVGPRTTLSPGESVTHREIWMIYAEVTVHTDEAAMQALVDQLGMTEGA